MSVAAWLGFKPYFAAPDSSGTLGTLSWNGALDAYSSGIGDFSVERLWREQPHLRTVIDFVARNIAQLGIHLFERMNDGGRERISFPLFDRKPNPDQTPSELIWQLVADLMLYDRAYWLVLRTSSGFEVRSLRPSWVVGTQGASAYDVEGFLVRFPNSPEGSLPVLIPANQVVLFHGYHPLDALNGASKIDALRSVLLEQVEAAKFRSQMWKRGGRIGTYVTRPRPSGNSDDWSPEARSKWFKDFATQWTGSDASASGVPLLDEGMELKQIRFSAREEQFVEATRLSLETVAQVFHVNPTMVGQLENANYSNVREFRRALYGETLGPVVKQIEERITAFLLPLVGYDSLSQYAEFNVAARLRGSFEEQASVFSTSVGGPWLTIDEARARQNLPKIPNGDVLIRPLNVTQPGNHEPIPADSNNSINEGDLGV